MSDNREFLGTEPINKLLFKLAVPTVAAQLTFVSIGNAPCSIIVAVVRKFVLLIPLIYIMPHIISDPAKEVHMAEPVADFIAVTFTGNTVLCAVQKGFEEYTDVLERFKENSFQLFRHG